ncbi:hypothetical protein [Pseudomonas extremaustralis]|uniref:hypothetical protein n=1 Tax=Pseudomonas extremaustralis TaxID=359110 RepID=UPI002AA827DA|nr:hypothetical protein [Pseudomonas extremaustralis]
MNSTEVHCYRMSVKVDYSHIDIEQVIKSELALHIGKRNTDELRDEIIDSLAAKLVPNISIGPAS